MAVAKVTGTITPVKRADGSGEPTWGSFYRKGITIF
jgi:hypothetical protein